MTTKMSRTKNDDRGFSLRPHGRVIGHSPLVIAQRDIHEDISAGGLEADHQRFCVFTGFVALLGGVQERWMNAEMKSLVVERGDGVADDLVGQFKDRFLDQLIGFGQFGARIVAGDLARRSAAPDRK